MTPGIAWDRLDEFTRFAVPLILGRFPHWERYAVTTPEGWVEFTVPCPNPALSAADHAVQLGARGSILAVTALDMSMGRSVDRTDRLNVAVCLDFLVDVLTDSDVLLTWYAGEKSVASDHARLPIMEWPPTCPEPYDFDRVTLRTWSGDGDRDWPAG